MNTIVVSSLFILTAFLLVSVTLAKVEEQKLFDETFWRTNNFKCRDPQPRAVPIYEVLGDKFETDKTYIPFMTVLHRCENSGCCQPSYSCSAKNIEQVELGIKVVKYKPHGKTDSINVPITAQNHTSCHCSEIRNIPK